jgi:hypothetical protein
MRKIILLTAGVAVVLISIILILVLNSPSRELTQDEKEKALAQIVGRKLNLTGKDIPQGDVEHKGKYMSFMYPAAAKIYHQTINGKEVVNNGALEYFAFDMEDPRVNVITEVIQATSSIIKLSDYPAVRLRQAEGSLYVQNEAESAQHISGLGFSKKDENSFEETAFFFANGKIYSLSITSADKKIEDKVFNKMISTLKIY